MAAPPSISSEIFRKDPYGLLAFHDITKEDMRELHVYVVEYIRLNMTKKTAKQPEDRAKLEPIELERPDHRTCEKNSRRHFNDWLVRVLGCQSPEVLGATEEERRQFLKMFDVLSRTQKNNIKAIRQRLTKIKKNKLLPHLILIARLINGLEPIKIDKKDFNHLLNLCCISARIMDDIPGNTSRNRIYTPFIIGRLVWYVLPADICADVNRFISIQGKEGHIRSTKLFENVHEHFKAQGFEPVKN